MPRECALDEGREYGRRARARAVRDAESEDGVFEAVELAVRAAEHLACELRRRIEMRWERKRRVLVERFGAARIAVDPDRTCVNDMSHVLRARGIEYQRCAARVHGFRLRRILDDVVDIGDCCEMRDHVAARAG